MTIETSDLARIAATLGRVEDDLARARGLVGDAMKHLFGTFDRLRGHLAVERDHYEHAIRAISGTGGETGLVAVVRDVLGHFVEDIVRLSRSSVRILVEVDALRGHAEEVAARGLRIEKIAQTTRVISLNARIEAQRVGESGAVFRVVADEIKALAHEAAALTKAIRGAIERQAASLDVTSAAAGELAATDLNVAVASHKQLEVTISQLADVSSTSTKALAEIQRDIDSAIQALQFEDMLDQLLAAIGRKLEMLRGACVRLAEGKEAALGDVERDAVTQRDVSTGAIELF